MRICCVVGQIKWPLLVQTVDQSEAVYSLPPGVQLMLIGVKLSTLLVAVAISNGKSLVISLRPNWQF